MGYNPKDHYFKKAKQENFAARSVFKLQEIDLKYKILRSGQNVLDLGAAPGSWSQLVSLKIGAKGRLLGVDLTPITIKLSNATFITADLRDLQLNEIFQTHGFAPTVACNSEQSYIFDNVLSDMAPKTTGIRSTDQARSMELCELALEVAQRFLKPGGSFVCKLFHSEDFQVLRAKMRLSFAKVEALKPDSTRKISKEIFLIGLNKK